MLDTLTPAGFLETAPGIFERGEIVIRHYANKPTFVVHAAGRGQVGMAAAYSVKTAGQALAIAEALDGLESLVGRLVEAVLADSSMAAAARTLPRAFAAHEMDDVRNAARGLVGRVLDSMTTRDS
jgi:hypothetical protein